MSMIKLGVALMLANTLSMLCSWLAYKCVVSGHEGFAITFIVMAFSFSVSTK
jgi:hypothetical protein